MKSLTKPLRDIGFLTIALTLALVANFAYGQWANPTSAPTAGNVTAPVTIGTVSQDKAGPLGVEGLGVVGGVYVEGGPANHMDFAFRNSVDGSQSTWSLRRNNGVGNWHNYINVQDQTFNVLQGGGYAYHERYNPGDGNYVFQVSDNTAPGIAGDTIGWNDAMTIGPGGVTINNLTTCDANGNNCTTVNNNSGGGNGIIAYMRSQGLSFPVPPPELSQWPDWVYCGRGMMPFRSASTGGVSYGAWPIGDNYIGTVNFNASGGQTFNNVGSCGGATIQSVCQQGRCGFNDGGAPSIDSSLVCNAFGCSANGACSAAGCPQPGETCTAYGCNVGGTCTAYGCS